MWGKWVFPTSHDPLNLPYNYGCKKFSLKNCRLDFDFFFGNRRNTSKNGVKLGEGSRAHLFEKLKLGLCHCILVPIPSRIP